MTHLAKKADTPGRFTFHSQGERKHPEKLILTPQSTSNSLIRLFLPSVWNNDNDMRIVDAVYDEYAVIHTIKTKEGVSQVLNKLYSKSCLTTGSMKLHRNETQATPVQPELLRMGLIHGLLSMPSTTLRSQRPLSVSARGPEVSEDLKQKFTQFSLDTGVVSDNIAFFPKNGTRQEPCTLLSWG